MIPKIRLPFPEPGMHKSDMIIFSTFAAGWRHIVKHGVAIFRQG